MDPHRMNQVLDNLLTNAVKYSPEGKKITVDASSSATGWEFRVIDEGVGMEKEQLDRIFEKFYRADSSNTARGGLGLGMSITKQIIESHGGSINVQSDIGRGTVVSVFIPFKGGEAVSA